MNKPARKSVRARWIVLTGQFKSSSNKNYVGTKFSCLKYDLQCTNFEPDKTYNTTMYMRPAKTQVSLCIDPLDKASFLHTVRSAKGLNRMCCCSRTVYSALDSPAIDGTVTAQVVPPPPPPRTGGIDFLARRRSSWYPAADLPDTPLQFPPRRIFRPPRFRRFPSAKPPTYL